MIAEAAPSARASNGTLGRKLELDRLEHRARRLQLVIAVLRERASASDSGPAPAGLRHAINDFARELSQVQRRLRADNAHLTR